MTQNQTILSLVVIAALLAALPTHASDAKNADISQKILGTWQLTKGTVGGAQMPENAAHKIELELTPGKYVLTGAESPDQGTWTLYPTQNPVGLDVTGTDGPNKGRTYLAIVQLHGNKMKVCYDLSGKTRPTNFESKPNTALFLAEYKRVKP